MTLSLNQGLNSYPTIKMNKKERVNLGRKRLEKTKQTIGLSIDADLLEQLNKSGVNKSRLFSIFAKKYLRKKSKR